MAISKHEVEHKKHCKDHLSMLEFKIDLALLGGQRKFYRHTDWEMFSDLNKVIIERYSEVGWTLNVSEDCIIFE